MKIAQGTQGAFSAQLNCTPELHSSRFGMELQSFMTTSSEERSHRIGRLYYIIPISELPISWPWPARNVVPHSVYMCYWYIIHNPERYSPAYLNNDLPNIIQNSSSNRLWAMQSRTKNNYRRIAIVAAAFSSTFPHEPFGQYCRYEIEMWGSTDGLLVTLTYPVINHSHCVIQIRLAYRLDVVVSRNLCLWL